MRFYFEALISQPKQLNNLKQSFLNKYITFSSDHFMKPFYAIVTHTALPICTPFSHIKKSIGKNGFGSEEICILQGILPEFCCRFCIPEQNNLQWNGMKCNLAGGGNGMKYPVPPI